MEIDIVIYNIAVQVILFQSEKEWFLIVKQSFNIFGSEKGLGPILKVVSTEHSQKPVQEPAQDNMLEPLSTIGFRLEIVCLISFCIKLALWACHLWVWQCSGKHGLTKAVG